MNNRLVVSVEVISLLKWIIENSEEELNDLVGNAIVGGCLDVDESSRFDTEKNLTEFQEVAMQFLALFEKNISKHTYHSKDLNPAVDELMIRLGPCNLDPVLIVNSIKTTSMNLKKTYQGRGAHPVLTQEDILRDLLANVLKNWQPGDYDAQA